MASSAPDSTLGLLPLHQGAQRQTGFQPQQCLRMPRSHLQTWKVCALFFLERVQHVPETLTGRRCQGALGRTMLSPTGSPQSQASLIHSAPNRVFMEQQEAQALF